MHPLPGPLYFSHCHIFFTPVIYNLKTKFACYGEEIIWQPFSVWHLTAKRPRKFRHLHFFIITVQVTFVTGNLDRIYSQQKLKYIYIYTHIYYSHLTVHRNRFLVNKTNRCTEFQFYWYYYSTCFGQPFCPSSGVLSRTSAFVHFMQLWPFAARSMMEMTSS